MKPYIGITGFKTVEEVERIGYIAEELGYPTSTHTVMFGYLASEKRVKHAEQPGKRSPAVKDIGEIVSHTPEWAISMIHYHTKNQGSLFGDVDFLVSETNADAVQLNVDWPGVESISKIKSKHTELDILLQLPERAMQGLSHDQICERVRAYEEIISYVLIDPSGGTGKEFDVDEGSKLLNLLESNFPQIVHGIAGGFTPENVSERLEILRKNVPFDFSIDAESGVMADNSLDEEKVRKYLERAR